MYQMPQDQYHDQLHFKSLNAHFNVHYPDISITIDIQFISCFQVTNKNTCFCALQGFVTLGHMLCSP